jgi:hypothetical protein
MTFKLLSSLFKLHSVMDSDGEWYTGQATRHKVLLPKLSNHHPLWKSQNKGNQSHLVIW